MPLELDSSSNYTDLSIEGVRSHLRSNCNSYQLLPELLNYSGLMEELDWLCLLGELWESFDNVSTSLDSLTYTAFGDRLKENISEMMTSEEIEFLRALPEEVRIYRGCYEENKWGLSWTLTKSIAKGFPFLRRYKMKGQPLLISAKVRRENIIAVKLGRGELEIIAWKPKHLATTKITEHKV